jgi:membrane associated rhomboid family serine protease
MSNEQNPEAFQGKRVREPIFKLPLLIAVLAVLMLAIQAVQSFCLNQQVQQDLVLWFGFLPLRLIVPDQIPGGILPLFWTPLTYGFLHAGWEHVIGNVAWLVIFGTPVARRYGTLRTLVIFFVASIVGALAFAIFQPVIVTSHPETGEPVALGRKMARLGEMLRSPPARNFTIIWLVLNCLVPLLPLVIGQDVGIAWQAHIGGFFTGLLLVPFFEPGADKGKSLPMVDKHPQV